MLTIVIPTYKRLANLKVLITHLDQFSAQFDIVIFNNDPDNFLTQKDVIQNQSTRDISIYNTTIHYGPDASLLHAMQLVTSEY